MSPICTKICSLFSDNWCNSFRSVLKTHCDNLFCTKVKRSFACIFIEDVFLQCQFFCFDCHTGCNVCPKLDTPQEGVLCTEIVRKVTGFFTPNLHHGCSGKRGRQFYVVEMICVGYVLHPQIASFSEGEVRSLFFFPGTVILERHF